MTTRSRSGVAGSIARAPAFGAGRDDGTARPPPSFDPTTGLQRPESRPSMFDWMSAEGGGRRRSPTRRSPGLRSRNDRLAGPPQAAPATTPRHGIGARGRAGVEVRVAADRRLTGEAAPEGLSVATRHDRWIIASPSSATGRWLRSSVTRRAGLIEAARGLVGQELVPVNRLVELRPGMAGVEPGPAGCGPARRVRRFGWRSSSRSRERGDQIFRSGRTLDGRRA